MNPSPEQLASIINEGINIALDGILGQVKSLHEECKQLRGDVDAIRSDVHRLESKSMGAAFVRR